MAIFASGYLLQDCELLDQLFRDDNLSKWNGTLNLQFIDLNYELKDVKLLKDAINENANTQEVNWNKMAPAIVLGICGGVSAVYVVKSKDEKARNMAIVAGVILIISAIILGGAALENRSGAVSKFNINDPIMTTIDQFLNEIEQQAPFSIHTDFFPNADVCIEKNKTSDVALGYDIDNTFDIFENLRNANLKENGEVIVVTKEAKPDKSLVKVMRKAFGPKGNYDSTIFK